MWKPHIHFNFLLLHYIYICTFGIWALIVIYPYGNLDAIDAYFFGVSASTESGLNTVDVKALKTYQQLFIYWVPIITNLGFISPIPVAVRLFWFKRHLKKLYPQSLRTAQTGSKTLAEGTDVEKTAAVRDEDETEAKDELPVVASTGKHIMFDEAAHPERGTNEAGKSIYVPSPKEREAGRPLEYKDADIAMADDSEDEDAIKPTAAESSNLRRRHTGHSLTQAVSMERVSNVAGSLFLLGGERAQTRSRRVSDATQKSMPQLSKQATIGRNSQFRNLTKRDREILGGIEYRALKLLLKVTLGYFFGMHIFGAIGLVGWIQYANPKYTEYLDSQGQNKIWWAFYSAQTMVDNLGFTLTPDSMISFRDATWPMLLMSFLAFAGNTLYPCLLRATIWIMSKIVQKGSETHESLQFLLDHPRRCYTLLFPSKPTWILFGVIFVLNFVDILLIIVCDLNNPELTALAPGPRVLAAIFQSASSRHTGTSTFNLANVNPAVQFSLMVMMYIAVFPIAISIRASNTYEERSLGVYRNDPHRLDEQRGASYFASHVRNQLSFDLWYVFLGVFCICLAESSKITDPGNPAFSVFAIFFEVVSAYGNVGLSLGHPDVLTSLCGQFTVFSKVVICAMMIRGRHRGLPYALDRAIMLPNERDMMIGGSEDEDKRSDS